MNMFVMMFEESITKGMMKWIMSDSMFLRQYQRKKKHSEMRMKLLYFMHLTIRQRLHQLSLQLPMKLMKLTHPRSILCASTKTANSKMVSTSKGEKLDSAAIVTKQKACDLTLFFRTS